MSEGKTVDLGKPIPLFNRDEKLTYDEFVDRIVQAIRDNGGQGILLQTQYRLQSSGADVYLDIDSVYMAAPSLPANAVVH